MVSVRTAMVLKGGIVCDSVSPYGTSDDIVCYLMCAALNGMRTGERENDTYSGGQRFNSSDAPPKSKSTGTQLCG